MTEKLHTKYQELALNADDLINYICWLSNLNLVPTESNFHRWLIHNGLWVSNG